VGELVCALLPAGLGVGVRVGEKVALWLDAGEALAEGVRVVVRVLLIVGVGVGVAADN